MLKIRGTQIRQEITSLYRVRWARTRDRSLKMPWKKI